VGKHDGKRSLGTDRSRWENKIKKDLLEVVWGAWTGLVLLRIGRDGELFKRSNEPSGSIKCREFLD
jgi:hypothetical protein